MKRSSDRQRARAQRDDASAAIGSVAHPRPRVRHLGEAANVDALLDAAVDGVGPKRREALDEVVDGLPRQHRHVGGRHQHAGLGIEACQAVAQALGDAHAVGPQLVGEREVAVSAHARRRDDDDSADRRRCAQRGQHAPDQRDAADFDERLVRRAGLLQGHGIPRAAREHHRIDHSARRQSGASAKPVTNRA